MKTKWGPGRSEVQGAFIKRRYVSMLVEMTQKRGRNDNAIQKLQKKKKSYQIGTEEWVQSPVKVLPLGKEPGFFFD